MMSALSSDIIKVRHDITDACDITKACWHHEWCQKADQLHRDVNVTHSWQGKSLNKCQIRISPDILNDTCTFSLTWSSVSHRTAGDRREYGIVIDTVVYGPCQTINKAFPRRFKMETVKEQLARPLNYSIRACVTSQGYYITWHHVRDVSSCTILLWSR